VSPWAILEDEMRGATIVAVCVSAQKGTAKVPVPEVEVLTDWGFKDDAHAGHWHRQVSLLSKDRIDAFNACGAGVAYGAFGENIVLDGVDLVTFPLGTVFVSGGVVLCLTQIGKQCHSGCDIQKRMGQCIMPTNGVFTKVFHGGVLQPGDAVLVYPEPRVSIICLSDKGYQGEREDVSSTVIKKMVVDAGFSIVTMDLFPDGRELLEKRLMELCDGCVSDLILTTGGTGLTERDLTPEATMAVAEKTVPGIAEAMRFSGLSHTPRAMLSRAVAVTRAHTLIVNLPGSPKAVEENLGCILPAMEHAVMMLRGGGAECART